jgi:GntR family histidine utilization transcriptional repressor
LRKQPPRYQQIKTYLLDAIQQDIFPPHSQIPTEHALAEQFSVSRMTVNKAIRDLVQMGMLVRTAGLGTYVTDLKSESPLQNINNIAEEVRLRGHEYSNEVIYLKEIAADERVAMHLAVKVGEPVYTSLIVHHENDLPIQLEERYVNPHWAGSYLEQDFALQTPNAYLTENCPLTDVEHVVEAVLPDLATAEYLRIDANEPCLLLMRRTWSDKHLISYAQLTHPGTRYKLRSQITLK